MLFLVSLAVLHGCASTPQTDSLLESADNLPTSLELEQVPFFPQREYQCGPAALATVLAASGVETTADELVGSVYVPEREGSFQVEMLAAARKHGRIPYELKPTLDNLIHELQAGRPVLVLQNLGLDMWSKWHYAVVVGFDLAAGELILRSGTEERLTTPMDVFENTWRRSEFWGVVMLKPGELPVDKDETAYFLTVSAFARVNEPKDTLLAYQAGVGNWPESQLLNMALANLYYSEGNLAEAAEHYRRLTISDPDFAPAHNNLAQVLSEMGEDESAIEHALKAVEIGGPYKSQYEATLSKIRH